MKSEYTVNFFVYVSAPYHKQTLGSWKNFTGNVSPYIWKYDL